jgi:hypothetical protein
MIEQEIDVRYVDLIRPGQETIKVKIIDRGENYDKNGDGKIPNHDKIDIDYDNSPKA